MNRKPYPDGDPATLPDPWRVLGSASSDTDGPAAGEILAAAGDLLRRSQRLGAKRNEIDAALARVPRTAVGAWLTSAEIAPAREGLRRAVDLAIEAALAADPAEQSARAEEAMAALRERDRFESCFVGLARFEAVAGGLGEASWSRDRLIRELDALDRAERGSARALCAVNAARRALRDRLDPDARERAYWYSARSECDAMAAFLGASSVAAALADRDDHLGSCEACRADVEVARVVDDPPERHLEADELWRLEVTEVTPLERRRAERHAAVCRDCAAALDALRDGDQAVREAE